jgi:hypothetical protein
MGHGDDVQGNPRRENPADSKPAQTDEGPHGLIQQGQDRFPWAASSAWEMGPRSRR